MKSRTSNDIKNVLNTTKSLYRLSIETGDKLVCAVTAISVYRFVHGSFQYILEHSGISVTEEITTAPMYIKLPDCIKFNNYTVLKYLSDIDIWGSYKITSKGVPNINMSQLHGVVDCLDSILNSVEDI